MRFDDVNFKLLFIGKGAMMKVFKVLGIVFWGLFLCMLCILSTGCDQLLEQVTTFDVSVEETIFDGESASGSGSVLEIANQTLLTGSAGMMAKVSSFSMSVVIPADAVLFSVLHGQTLLKIQGTVENLDANPVVFGVYLGLTDGLSDPVQEGVLLLTQTLGAYETVQIDMVLTNLEDFIDRFQQSGTIYVYMTGTESSSVNIFVHNLVFSVPASTRLSMTLTPDAYEEYLDQVEDISTMEITGSAVNHGAHPVDFMLSISSSGLSWQEIYSFEETNGGIFLFADWYSTFVENELEHLRCIIEQFIDGGEPVLVELFIWSEGEINLEIISMVLNADIQVDIDSQ